MRTRTTGLTVVVAAALAGGVRADVLGPYTADSNTLHLYHLDESADNAEDSGFVDANDIDLKMHNPAAPGAGTDWPPIRGSAPP